MRKSQSVASSSPTYLMRNTRGTPASYKTQTLLPPTSVHCLVVLRPLCTTSSTTPTRTRRLLYRCQVSAAATVDNVMAVRRRCAKPSPRQADATPLLASDGGGAAERTPGETCEALLASGPLNAAELARWL